MQGFVPSPCSERMEFQPENWPNVCGETLTIILYIWLEAERSPGQC